jgi:PAS domain S-box-containing protein
MGVPEEDAGRTVNDRRNPGVRPGESGLSAREDPLQERIARLEARLADMAPDPDAHVNALYTGIRSLVGELIRRRRQAEETCETLTRVLEATSDGFVALDADWRYTYVNAHAGQMFNRDPAYLIGKHIWTEFPEGVGQPFQQEYERAAADGTPHQIEAYYPPYGKWFENRIYPYAGGLAIFFQDVTDRRTAEDRLRESEQRYRSLFDHHPDAVYSFDRDGRFVSANAACEGLSGYSPEELIGKPFAPLIVPENRLRTLERFRGVMSGVGTSYEETILHKSGRRIEVAITALPIVVDGNVVGMYGIAKDLTARRELEARLQHAERMQAVGRLAASVAHDFNNLLTIIQSCASMITTDLPATSQSHADAQEILKASRRASELTQQLLAFSRKQVLQPQRVDVNLQITSFLGMLRRVMGTDIRVETELAADTWQVFADPGQLERVLMNLGVNARDAMPNGGTLRLRTENIVLDSARVSESVDLSPGAYVRIVIEDTGTGIDPSVLPHIFEPFVTTKPQGLGTGLGLATVYGIIEQTGGTIRVDTTPGRGSRFSVYLPRAEDDSLRRTA